MLCLSRKPGEVLLIGPDIQVKVIETRAGLVRLGIVAPSSMPVFRAELVPDRQDVLLHREEEA